MPRCPARGSGSPWGRRAPAGSRAPGASHLPAAPEVVAAALFPAGGARSGGGRAPLWTRRRLQSPWRRAAAPTGGPGRGPQVTCAQPPGRGLVGQRGASAEAVASSCGRRVRAGQRGSLCGRCVSPAPQLRGHSPRAGFLLLWNLQGNCQPVSRYGFATTPNVNIGHGPSCSAEGAGRESLQSQLLGRAGAFLHHATPSGLSVTQHVQGPSADPQGRQLEGLAPRARKRHLT